MGGKMKEEKYKGLSSKEVEELTNQGKVNVSNNNNLKSNWQIIKDNVCTLFNLYNLIIAIALLAVGAYTNTYSRHVRCTQLSGMRPSSFRK